MPRDVVSTGQLFLAMMGVGAWVVAVAFATWSVVEVKALHGNNVVTLTAPNVTASGAACGFAIAGAICLHGAARRDRGGAEPR